MKWLQSSQQKNKLRKQFDVTLQMKQPSLLQCIEELLGQLLFHQQIEGVFGEPQKDLQVDTFCFQVQGKRGHSLATKSLRKIDLTAGEDQQRTTTPLPILGQLFSLILLEMWLEDCVFSTDPGLINGDQPSDPSVSRKSQNLQQTRCS